MNWNPLRPWLGTAARLLLGVVWLWAAWAKLQNPRGFTQAVRAYDATPEWLSRALGYGLPVLEISLAALLLVGVAVRLCAAVSAALFLLFLAGVTQAAARGLRLDCGCFGGGGPTGGPTHYALDILRDLGLLAAAAYLIVWSATRISVEEFLARHDHVPAPSAKRMRTEQGRRKYQAMIEARQEAARDRARYLNATVALLVVLVSFIGIGVQAGRAKIQGDLTASNATAATGVVFGKAAAATVDVYEDFQCPHCLAFEQDVHTTLEADVRANKAQVRYHPLAFLDADSRGTHYSTRAADAALCASDVSVDAFTAYHDVLFTPAVQPAEGSSGRSDVELVTLAQKAGLTPTQVTTFTSCVQTQRHKALVQAITEDASRHGVTGTPTVRVNGETLTGTDLATLTAAIAAADAHGPAPSPSPTASPSPTRPGGATRTPTPAGSPTH